MQNIVLAATSKLKSSYVDVVFTSVCKTPSWLTAADERWRPWFYEWISPLCRD